MIPTLNYIGPSMNPTLKAGDGLIVVAYEDSPIFVGDVVVFRHPEKKHRIAHRVVTVDSRGLTTRGDGNHRLDPWVLTRTDIIGRVVAAQRMTKKTIHGGACGRIQVSAVSGAKKVDAILSKILHPAYHQLAESGVFLWLVPYLPKLRFLSFRRPNGNELQLFMGNYMVGRYLPGTNRWRIIRPFRLFVDEEALKCHRPKS